MNRLKFHIRRDQIFGKDLCVVMYRELAEGHVALATPVEFTAMTMEQAAIKPNTSLQITSDSAQQLMDELWNVGLRPTEGTGSAGSLAATERHLSDMRALVFKQTPKG